MEGELRHTARLGELTDESTLRTTTDGAAEVETLLRTFLHHEGPIAGTAQELATRMAGMAKLIRDATIGVLKAPGASSQLPDQLEAFRQVLLPDLSEDDFADMYAQTIAYGLFAARCYMSSVASSATGSPATGVASPGFTRFSASQSIPPTNPFLQDLFYHITGPSLDDRIAWIVDDLANFLGRADMSNVMEDFAKRTGREDPVVHFYETFLKEYDPRLRQVRGVYYTPEPVVSYIVRSVDHILKTDFERPLGL